MDSFTPLEPQRLIDEHLRSVKDALLFVGMGIGKSAACLYRLNELLQTAESIGALVIAPLRVANLTWPMEVKQWKEFSWMKVANLRTEKGQREFLNGTSHIYLINWESINLLCDLVWARKGELPYDTVILDELTKAKNPGSKRVNLYRRRVPRATRHWGLTGTPTPNSWTDLFAQVRLVDGGKRLGTQFLQFKRTYFRDPEVSKFEESRQDTESWSPKPGAYETIEGQISDITLTLKSSDWLDIPDTVFEDIEIPLSDELMKRYRRLESELVIQLTQGKEINVANAAALVTKLLQFTSGHMYDDEKDAHPIHNRKFDALAEVVKKEQQPLLVASIYQHEQARIRSQFPKARFFTDARNIRAQEELMASWNRGEIPMLVAHPASIGHGLNLQYGSSAMVWISLTYSRELYDQFIARIARRGQDQLIKVYRLMCPGTVDDVVAEALATKGENQSRLLTALQMLESYRKTP